ncbi:MAG TPA: hypothetical protein VIK04_12895 [Solirubrobacteraceae bacterium]
MVCSIPCRAPRDRFLVAAELDHCLSDPDELMRPREIASEQRDDRGAVTVKHGEPLARVPRGEPVLILLRGQQGAELRQADLAQSGSVAHRIGLEEVLIGEAESDHPSCEPDWIGNAGIARAGV